MKEKLTYLRWFDILIVSAILFGSAIYDSTITFITTDPDVLSLGTEFTPADNIYAMITEISELTFAFIYLRLRRFDFSRWKYKVTLKGTLTALILFLLISVLMDIADILVYGWADVTAYVGEGGIFYVLSEIDITLLLFSLLNGFYEEIFFIGIATAVKKEHQIPALIYSLIIRTSFHTYQGIVSALEIGICVGLVFYLYYRKKDDNLYPVMTSHALADIFGAGIISLL